MNIAKLHYITQDLVHIPHWEQARKACEGGANWVQLRVKNQTAEEWYNTALKTQEVCKHFGTKLIINDNPALALKIQADGVHLGKTDMPPLKARAILGNEFIIGGTANTLEDINELLKTGTVQYIGLGPYRFTKTKKNLSPILGLQGYQSIFKEYQTWPLQVPIVGIGGVLLNDIPDLLAVGLHGVAVSSVINLSENPVSTTQDFLETLYNTHKITRHS